MSTRGPHKKLWGPKVVGIPTLEISGFPFGSPGTKCHLDVGLVERYRVYYKGGSGGFPQVRAVVSLVSLSYLWLVLTPKVLQLCTNHLVFGFVQVRVSS
jgi:ferric iron reductase protein FhuF